jgi:nicotinate phosphoribosyltransferase
VVHQATSLLTDRYELTMLDAALKAGTHDRECVFECFARRLPSGRRFGVVAGTGRLLELIRDFRFGDAELEYLRAERVVGDEALTWLADYRFRGRITGYREGEAYFPGSPLLTVEAPFADGVILETLVLSVLNYDSAVASAAARMVQVAQGRPLAEMGSRRTGERSAVAAARAAFIAGFSATSNLEAGRTWGVPTMGTAAHSFTLLHDTEEQAFRAQVDALGAGTTLLVDTFDVTQGVETAVRVAGTGLGAVRLDSGDLPVLVGQVRAQLDALGATGTRITVTNDLDEYGIATLSASPVDSYGVGTSLVTGSGAPAAGMVFKLVAHRAAGGGEWVSVAKRSTGKQSRGGLKAAVRRHDARGVASAEVVTVGGRPTPPPEERDLLVTLVEGGEPDPRWLGAAGTAAAREHHARVMRDLPVEAFRLRAGDPAIPTEEGTAA